MRALITLYRKSFEVPDEVSDSTAAVQMLILSVFFFVLGFTFSQVIIFLAA